MKKIYYTFLLFSFTYLFSYSQFELRNYNTNTIINDGDALNYNTTGCGYPFGSCVFKFILTNTSSTDVRLRAVIDSRINADNDDGQLCIGSGCFINLNLNQGYPNNAVLLSPGSSIGTSGSQSFYNLTPSGSTTPMSWTIRFQAYDASDNEIGTPITVTYNYDSTFSTSEFNLSDVKIYPNQSNKTLVVDTSIDLNAEIYSILGKKVKTASLSDQNNQINVSQLTPQIYIVRLTDNIGNSITRKVVLE